MTDAAVRRRADGDDRLDESAGKRLLNAEGAWDTSEPIRRVARCEPDLGDCLDDDADQELRPEDPGDAGQDAEQSRVRERCAPRPAFRNRVANRRHQRGGNSRHEDDEDGRGEHAPQHDPRYGESRSRRVLLGDGAG